MENIWGQIQIKNIIYQDFELSKQHTVHDLKVSVNDLLHGILSDYKSQG